MDFSVSPLHTKSGHFGSLRCSRFSSKQSPFFSQNKATMIPLEIMLHEGTKAPPSRRAEESGQQCGLAATATPGAIRRDPLRQGSTHCIRQEPPRSSLYHDILQQLGPGPARFGGYKREETLKNQLKSLSMDKIEAFASVTVACEDFNIQNHVSAAQIFRITKFHNFDKKKSLRMLRHIDARLLNMTAQELEGQLISKTLLPLPSLHAKAAQDLFYMRPSRFVPRENTTSAIIANLIYVMDTIYECTRDDNRSTGVIANMNDWTMEDNFNMDYCWAFMHGLQGRLAPAKVDLFLIVNPPKWFGKVWSVMKPMLNPGFRRKVHMIAESELGRFLEPGFEQHLPNEFQGGQVSLDDLARDFVLYRRYVEEQTHCRKPCKENMQLLQSTTNKRGQSQCRRHSLSDDSWYMSSHTTGSEASFPEE